MAQKQLRPPDKDFKITVINMFTDMVGKEENTMNREELQRDRSFKKKSHGNARNKVSTMTRDEKKSFNGPTSKLHTTKKRTALPDKMEVQVDTLCLLAQQKEGQI